MTVKLVWVTPDADRMIAYLARVSAPENQARHETADRLIQFLIRNRHWSPFEMVNLCVEVNLPRDIGRQMLRHAMRVQEFSQRYADVRKLGGEPELREARLADPSNRQKSIDWDDPEVAAEWEADQREIWEASQRIYGKWLDRGMAREVSRAVLPEGLTPTRMYFNGYLRDWLFYCELRRGNGTQAEHVGVAEGVWEIIKEVFPVTSLAWERARS
ncbi:FAD-dependent thymidylate synthase [Falsiroseomonas sp. CW058]|uniref:FAD-dependent thymidylate synthase n=1 Tax=Falsiroseomonas sp. CW058 TaxID=3388664 RepID=UPI003D323B40